MKAIRCLFIIISSILTFQVSLLAQEAAEGQPKYGWKNEIVGNLNLTQASFSNWEQGGENSLAWQINLTTNFTLDQEKDNWTNTGKVTLGYAKVGGNEARKSADELKLESVYNRKISQFLNPFVAVTAKTQFLSGFQYDENNKKTKISEFLDPGYFTQSVGVGYTPNEQIKTRLGIMVKETVTDIFPEESKIEPGITSVTDFKRKFEENVLFTSRMEIFSDLEAFDRIDILWENNLTLKVSKFVNVNVNVDLLYDKDISEKRQLRQVLAVGFTYSFL